MLKGRDVWWEDEIKKVEAAGNPDCPAEEMDAEDMLFILYHFGQYRQTERRGAYCADIWFMPPILSVNVFQYKPEYIFFLHSGYRMDHRA